MILNFPGGVRPQKRTIFGKQKIKYIDNVPAVCIFAPEGSVLKAESGAKVSKGTLIGEADGTPIYSPIPGTFRGIAELAEEKYFVVINDGSDSEEILFEPETRGLLQLSKEDVIESAKKFGIIDSRSGQPLWKLLDNMKNCRRVVVDCTETTPASAINYRLCLEKAKSAVGGAKVLIRATGAVKCVFAFEHYRTAAYEELAKYATDEKLFAAAMLEEKYPYGDRALMSALYLETLGRGETAADRGIFTVGLETVCALYDAMVTGIPQLGRYITFCGDNLSNGGNFFVPFGTTVHDLVELCGGIDSDKILVENSLLSGKPIQNAIKNGTRAIITVKPDKKVRAVCISCGKCAEACPVKLVPRDILSKKSRKMKRICIGCGACDYICPSGIPLRSLIEEGFIPKNEFAESEV